MFTQCPECGTVFRVTAPVLRAAQGQVRCGVCDANFDALRFLTDSVDAPVAKGPEAAAPPPAAAPRAAPVATRTTPSEDEGRALAEIAATLARDAHPPARPAAPAAAEDVNVLEPSDIEDIVLGDESAGARPTAADDSLEFSVPAGEWDRVFVREQPRPGTALDIDLASLAAKDRAAPEDGEHPFVLVEDEPDGKAPTADELSLVEDDALATTGEYDELEVELGAESAGGIEETWFDPTGARAKPPAEVGDATAAPPGASSDAPEPLAEEFAALPLDAPPPGRDWHAAYVAGVAILGLLLAAQLVHVNRETLAGVPGLGPAIGALYARLGQPIEPRWDLGAYEVKQWGAATDAAPGALHLRASVVNRGQRAQPYPLLRITLEDRFGASIARGEFAPAEYLPGRSAPADLLAPGARADADLVLADPGSQAVGFELDVCLKRGAVLKCGGEIKPRGAG